MGRYHSKSRAKKIIWIGCSNGFPMVLPMLLFSRWSSNREKSKIILYSRLLSDGTTACYSIFMFLAEAAVVEIHNQVNSNQGGSYSVTTTTVNGVTTTETKTYAPGDPVIVAATASATGQKNQTNTPIVTPLPPPSPIPENPTPPTAQSFLHSIFDILYSKFLSLFRR